MRKQAQKNKFIKALEECKGIVSTACRKIGISRQTYYKWLKNDPDFETLCNDISEEAIDFVESKLLEKIEQGDTTAIIYFLKTKGKKRGWSEKTEAEPQREIRPEQLLPIDLRKKVLENLEKISTEKEY